MALRHRVRSESGFAMIEAVVSAAVLAIVAMAVLSGIDGAQNSSAREKARAVAANLAEQDQERLRSLSISALSATGSTSPVTVDGVTYTVQSQAAWVTDDAGGTPSCGNSSTNNEYIHITSTVTSSIVGTRVQPVEIDSLVAPSVAYSNSHGTLGVKVVNRNGVGVPGINVNASTSSPAYAPPTAATDSAGCALFRNIPIGTYTISLSSSGYVDPDGNQQTSASQKVSPGTASFKTMEYDLATRATVSVKTDVPGATTQELDSKALAVSATNGKRAGLLRTFANASTTNSFNATQLFPFAGTAYAFFTGKCAYESPVAVGSTNYFSTYSGSLLADPTVSQPQSVKVLQPPLNLRISAYSSGLNSALTTTVYATLIKPSASATDPCSEPTVQMAIKSWPSAWGSVPGGSGNSSGWIMQNDLLSADPGMPFGTYKICAKDLTGKYATTTYVNTVPGGQPTTVNLSSWTSTSCLT